MTVENTNNKMPPQQMGAFEYDFTFPVLLEDPTETEAKAAIKATVKSADGNIIDLIFGASGTDGYDVILNSTGYGGKIIVNNKRTNEDYITIYRKYTMKQEADYQDFNASPADTLERCFDKALMVSQQIQEELDRTIKVPITSSITNLSLPNPIPGRTLKWNNEGTGFANSDASIDKIDEQVKISKACAEFSLKQATIVKETADEAEQSAAFCSTALDECREEVEKAKIYAQEGGGGGMPTDICKNLNIDFDTENRKIKLRWKDPNDTINTFGQIMSSWKGTKIVCKTGEYPANYDDGTIILNSMIKNQYQNKEFEYDVPATIEDITSLKFRAFPYSANNIYNKDKRNCFDQTIIYEFLLDDTNSNINGRITRVPGSTNEHFKNAKMNFENNIFDYGSWIDTFIMHLVKPCMLYNKNANNIGLKIKGNLGTESGILSGFTTGIYGDINFVPENIEDIESFEIAADFTTNANITTAQQTIYGNSITNAHSPQLAIINKKIQWDIPNSSYAYTGALISTNELEPETSYISKLKYNKTESLLSAYLATNGGADVKIAEISVSSFGWNEAIRLGLDLTANPFGGSINIKGCYIKINDEKVFDGSKYKCLNGQVMEYLNPDDYSLTIDGKPSHIADETCNANAMAEWKIKDLWIRIDEYLPKKYHVYIANKQVDENYKNWLRFNKKGEIRDYYYRSIYDACNIDNILRSISGKAPCVNTPGATQVEYAKSNGEGYDVDERRFITVRNTLLMLISGSSDSQATFGAGRNSGGSSNNYNQLPAGQLNNKGQFYGDNGNGCVKVFHSENPWGNVWKFEQGVIQTADRIYIKLTPNNNDGSEATEYNITGNGYIDTGIILSGTSGGYISELALAENHCFLPKVSNGSSSTSTPDGCWRNGAVVGYSRFGGSSDDGLLCGAFALALDNPASISDWRCGAALSCTPL